MIRSSFVLCSIILLSLSSVALSAVETPPQDDGDLPNYRLPNNIKPLAYALTLTPHVDDTHTTHTGQVDIEALVLADTETIVLHARTSRLGINVSSIAVHAGRSYKVINTAQDNVTDFFTITLSSTLRAGLRVKIRMQFQGREGEWGARSHELSGVYKSWYMHGGERRWLVSSELEPIHARSFFPCFDEAALKARFKIIVCRKAHLHSLSNMPLHHTTHTGVLSCDHFEETPLMSTYLTAFVTSDFAHISSPDGKFRIFTQPDKIQQAVYSLSISPRVMAWYETYTGIKYSLPKMDQVAIPRHVMPGAMENWGLVTYDESSLLFEDGVTSAGNKQTITTMVAHEFAHQWFGNLVTAHWWSDLWLQEGIATYFEYLAAAHVEPRWRLNEIYVPYIVQYAMVADAESSSGAMSRKNMTDRDAVIGIFDDISYSKSGSVIRMLSHIMSETAFQKAIQGYLKNSSLSISEPSDLFSQMDLHYRPHLEDETGPSIQQVMDNWINQPGYPVVHVIRDYNSLSAEILQEGFGEHNGSWFIPLTYTTQDEMDFLSTSTKKWFNQGDTSVTVSDLPGTDEWILFNIQETGYYRVKYDEHNWHLLSEYLDSPSFEDIHPLNRAQLLDDSFNLARYDLLNYSIPLKLALYLQRETDYIPWSSALRVLGFIDGDLLRDPAYSTFRAYFTQLISPLYERLGFEESPSDDHLTRLGRAEAVFWACKMDLPGCVQAAQDKLEDWITSGTNRIRSDVKTDVYCTALRHGGQREWDFLLDEYNDKKTDFANNGSLRTGLGCTQHPQAMDSYANTFVRQLLDEYENYSHTAEDISADLTDNPSLIDAVMDFIISHWTSPNTSREGLSEMREILTSHLYTQAQVDKFKTFFLADEETKMNETLRDVIENVEVKKQGSYGAKVIACLHQELGFDLVTKTTAAAARAAVHTAVYILAGISCSMALLRLRVSL